MRFKNLIRKIQGKPQIIKTETGNIRIYNFSGEMEEYSAVILNADTLREDDFKNKKDFFYVISKSELWLIPTLKMSYVDARTLEDEGRIFLSKNYKDCKNNKIIKGRFRKV